MLSQQAENYRVENNWETPEKEKNTRQRQTRMINQIFILCLPEYVYQFGAFCNQAVVFYRCKKSLQTFKKPFLQI